MEEMAQKCHGQMAIKSDLKCITECFILIKMFQVLLDKIFKPQ